ncbi:MAG: hypothetical protein QW818_00740 [Candidatus Aenigmatarchaeota archaeon]|nr:hypothetical protein [Candidatus Aenigmarchaeota archaeon]
MALFGRKRKEEPKETLPELPPLSALDQTPIPEEPKSPPIIKREPESPPVAPLFVKMDRYRQILTTIGNLKTAVMIVKNSLGTLQQIEKVRDETFNIVNDIVEKIDNKIIELDNNLLRPAGFHESEEIFSEQQDIRTIEATVADLRGQIEQLKSELSKMI